MDRALRAARRGRVATVLALVSVLAFTSVGNPASVRAGTPTVTTLEVPAGVQHGSFDVIVHVRPAPQPDNGLLPAASIFIDGSFSRPSGPLDENGDATASMSLPPGTYSIVAKFGPWLTLDASESAPASVTVKVSTAVALISSVNPAASGESVTIQATVSPSVPTPEGAVIPGGTLSIVDGFDGSTIASGPVSGATTTSVSVTRIFATGSHVLTASYSGSGDYEGSHSEPLTQVVNADTGVDASNFGVSYTTFYPVTDGYRDSVSIRGTLNEAASVTIRVYSPTGSVVRNANLGLRAIGPYAYAWNGRSSTGSVLAAGRYKVVQQVTDTASNVLTVTLYVTLSRKRVVWTTVTKTLYGSQYSAVGDYGTGYVTTSRSPYYRGVRISSGSTWVAVRYSFALHSASIYSNNLTFRVIGKSPNGTQALEGLWNRTYGTSLNVNSYDVRLIGPAYATWSIAASSSVHRTGTTAFGMVYAGFGAKAGQFNVAKVQLTYRWGVLV